jgi:hypothetical protein
MPQNMSLESYGIDRGRSLQKILTRLHCRTCALIAPIRPILYRSLCSYQMVLNAQNMNLAVQWGGSRAFILKNFDATLLHVLVH